MLDRKLWHKSLTDDVIMEACDRRLGSLDNPGLCLMCGAEQVFGCEELMMEIA